MELCDKIKWKLIDFNDEYFENEYGEIKWFFPTNINSEVAQILSYNSKT